MPTLLDILLFVLITIVLIQVSLLRRLVYNTTYNDVHELMTEIMYEVFDRLPDNDSGKALRSYLRDQRNDIYAGYLEAKRRGIRVLKDSNFLDDLKGYTKTDLRRHYDFSNEFCEQAEQITAKNLNQFANIMLIDINDHRNFRKALKNNLAKQYRKTVFEINDLYKLRYGQQILSQDTAQSGCMNNVSGVDLDKNKLKKKIGKGNIDEVLKTLENMPLVSERQRNMLVMFFKQYNSYIEKLHTNMPAKEQELNRLTYNLLKYIDELA